MQIHVKDLIKSLDYKLSYFLKLLTKAQVKSRIILDKDDLTKLSNSLETKNYKSFQLHTHLTDLLSNEDKKASHE